ncbi:class E sortase [Streptomyces fimicarius]|uniref:class E sortase n=1 Tax=Streptomyces griseus TaxID=1911 RepID=UPI000A3B449B|nr:MULTISPECIES: class E sortase [Streptomyces griseus group]MCX4710112.1 class E sortase [Streptomyces griseus]
MTAGRPGPDAGPEGPHPQGAYGADGAFVAAVDGLADPLNDPLPGGHASPWFRADNIPAGGPAPAGPGPALVPDAGPGPGHAPHQGPQQPQGTPNEWYDPAGYQRDWYGSQEPSVRIAEAAAAPVAPAAPVEERATGPAPAPGYSAEPRTEVIARIPAEPAAPYEPAAPFEPAAPYEPDVAYVPDVGHEPARERESGAEDPGPDPDPAAAAVPPPSGGRAERRRAAKGRGRRRPGPAVERAAPAAAPMSRMEARRAAKAAKDSPAVVASRVVGEVFISLGVLMLLFVTYQLWWTNIRAEQIAGKETDRIQDEWANGDRKPGVFAPGQGFAIMHIPKLDVVAPIAEGIDKEKVLDRGMIGHYGEGKLKTAMPSDEQGNFAVAGHRNTHGEPFRYINKLTPGDPIVVETRDAYYTYEMASILPQTSPSNISVIEPVPVGSGFEGPGKYLTLTTCTPEFTSTYRLIVWGKMVDERPRSEGKPDALLG